MILNDYKNILGKTTKIVSNNVILPPKHGAWEVTITDNTLQIEGTKGYGDNHVITYKFDNSIPAQHLHVKAAQIIKLLNK